MQSFFIFLFFFWLLVNFFFFAGVEKKIIFTVYISLTCKKLLFFCSESYSFTIVYFTGEFFSFGVVNQQQIAKDQASSLIMSSKILSENPTELELKVAQAFVDLESQADLKAELRPLQFKSIKEIDVNGGKKALAVFVPPPSLQAYRKVQTRLTRELEKKFPDRHVVFLAERRILPKPARKARKQQKRPRSRTLTAVHDKILEDLVFPTEIIGKRVRYLVGGNKIQKVLLDSKDSTAVDYKLDSFQQLYSKLTGKQVVFEIPGESH